MKPRLTIAIPTYNRAHLLKCALESALAQTSNEIAVLVSDNGSSDSTQALLAGYNDPRLRVVRHEVTMPRARHGTFLFGEVQTEFVLILSDDDSIEPEFALEILRLFDEHPEISFAYTGCIEHYDGAKVPALVGPRIESSLDFFAAHYAGRRHVFWCACVTRLLDIMNCGPQPDDRIIGDMFFWTRIGFKGPIGCVNRPLSHYSALRPSGDNESRAIPVPVWSKEVKVIADEVMLNVKKAGADIIFQNALKTHMEDYSTRSIANQFIWCRISGVGWLECFQWLLPTLRFNNWTMSNLIRMFAAFVLPPTLLRYLVVIVASEMTAKQRR